MASSMPTIDQIKLGLKMVDFKVQQRRYRTSEKTIVSTIYGPVKGVKRKSIYGQSYFSFEKIPFAKPPVGELRYKAPQPPEVWTEVRSCTSMGPKPLQKHFVFQMTEGSEDCLYLNVYTKNLNPIKPMPVMVWIFGGGFQFGEASRDLYSPDYLLREDVVMISITYRLGPFGFLCMEDPSFGVPGNAGLKDQVMALRWVKANCDRFGGDSSNITIFGDSAGGASCHYMMITEQTRGLFHKAICMSGNSLSPWAVTPQRNWPYRLAVGAGYTGENNEKDVYEFLRTAKGSDIVRANEDLCMDEEKRERIGFAFGPVIEPYLTPDCVVPKKPIELMRTAWSNKIPMIIGGVSNEGLLLYTETKTNPKLLNDLGDCRFVVPMELNMDRDSELCKEYGQQLRKTYYGEKDPSLETLHEYLLMVSHEYFWFPIYRTVLSRMEHAPDVPTFLYRFDFDSKHFNHLRILSCGKKVRGTCHGDDLSYLFYNSVARKLKKTSREYKCIEKLVGMWTHFATYGNPNFDPELTELWQPLTHVAVEKRQPKCLNISDDLKVIDVPDMKKLMMWESFFGRNELT
ncbi:esterase B1 [Teleopsis dalmanni]|uniref:esterase B1 n=1 Tax=Teleopsis dalmanni TaxID=139649 RepID=UPI0018CFC0F6|nr:esterase B1 [Teleopsis dalmanni]